MYPGNNGRWRSTNLCADLFVTFCRGRNVLNPCLSRFALANLWPFGFNCTKYQLNIFITNLSLNNVHTNAKANKLTNETFPLWASETEMW